MAAPRPRRIIRKVPAPRQLAIDEQYWPVMLALFVLCGFLMGTVAAYLPFGARHWWQDARTWLFAIPVMSCAAVWGLRRLPSRVVRRALQISIVICLLFHLIMLIVSLESRIFSRIREQLARQQPRRPQRELRVVNEYQPHQLDRRQRQQQDFVQPVETDVPDPEMEQQVERQQEQPEQVPVEPRPMPAPETPREIQRQAKERPTPAETRPRFSEQNSRLSRQVAEARPSISEPVNTPATAAPTARSSALESRGDNLRQQAAETAVQPVSAPIDPAAAVLQEPARIARQATERAPETDTRSTPTLPRQVAQPTAVARVDVRSGDTPSTARVTDRAALEPARTTMRQQLTATPRESRQVEPQPVTPVAPQTTPATQREQPGPEQPQLANTPVPAANRQPRNTSRPDVATAAAVVAPRAGVSPDSSAAIEASTSTVTRANSATSPATNVAATAPAASPSSSAAVATSGSRSSQTAQPSQLTAAAPTPRAAPSARAAGQTAAITASAQGSESPSTASQSLAGGNTGLPRQMSLRSAAGATASAMNPSTPAATPTVAAAGERAQANERAAANPVGTATNHLARAARSADVATSTTLADTPRRVTVDTGGNEPQARPSRLAMTQSLSGIAGVGQTANLDRSPSAPGSPSTTASGSARRAEATQNTPPGPALAPSATSIARRSLVGVDRPSSSLRATTAAVASAAGTESPSEMTATSGASLARQDANATRGEVTAARGTVDIDLGPTRVADAGGFERASGGGQPEVNLDQDAASLARSRSGGHAPLSVASTAVDVSAASPGGGQFSAAGQPTGSELTAATSETRQETSSGASGSASARNENDPQVASTTGTRERMANSGLARTESAQEVPAMGGATEANDEEEEEERRRLARAAAASSAPGQIAGPIAIPEAAAASESAPVAAESTELAGTAGGGTMARQLTASAGGAAPAAEQVTMASEPGGGNLIGEPTMRRAEVTEGVEGPAMPGGGTAGQQRAATGRAFAAQTTADTITIAGAPASSGSPRGIDAAAQGDSPAPTATGAIGRTANQTVGAAAGVTPMDAEPQSGVDVTVGLASRSTTAGDAPAIGQESSTASPLARASRAPRSAGPSVAAVVGPPTSAASVKREGAELQEAAIGIGATPAARQSAAPLPVEVAAIHGAGGLGDRVSLDVGIPSRLATPESIDVQSVPSRFVRQDVGGAPELNTSAVYSSEAFRGRSPGRNPSAPQPGSSSAGPRTEEAIELGLAYLARRQLPDGSWTLRSANESVQLASDTAATGLCLLAFQGAGYSHREHKYAAQMVAAIDYLVKNQKPDGDLFVPVDDVSNRSVWLYSHGIAAIALCEAYGMTHDPALREPAQKALDFIVAAQDQKGGGWRYQPGVASDTSVTGWMMMALKSGELAGLKVARPTYDHIGRWLESAQGSGTDGHLYRYNPFAPDSDSQRHGRLPTPTMTAVGLLMRLYGGWRRDHPTMIAGAEYLRENLPAIGTTSEPLRDTYYWYYGTQVMFHMGGALWEEWNGQLHPMLIQSQETTGALAGSWSPDKPVPDRWAPHAGRLYVTTMNLLSLEVTYRHLPLYVETGR